MEPVAQPYHVVYDPHHVDDNLLAALEDDPVSQVSQESDEYADDGIETDNTMDNRFYEQPSHRQQQDDLISEFNNNQ